MPKGECDSTAVLEALSEPEADVVSVLSHLEGPWALVFWQQDKEILWIARDVLGRSFCDQKLEMALLTPERSMKASSIKLQCESIYAFML